MDQTACPLLLPKVLEDFKLIEPDRFISFFCDSTIHIEYHFITVRIICCTNLIILKGGKLAQNDDLYAKSVIEKEILSLRRFFWKNPQVG